MVDQTVGVIVRRQKRPRFGLQRGVAGAGVVKVSGARFWSVSEGRVEHGLDVLPLPGHHDRAFLISRCSHALATFRSRLTVAGDTPTDWAVSSIVRPPKNLSSTIRHCCGSM